MNLSNAASNFGYSNKYIVHFMYSSMYREYIDIDVYLYVEVMLSFLLGLAEIMELNWCKWFLL